MPRLLAISLVLVSLAVSSAAADVIITSGFVDDSPWGTEAFERGYQDGTVEGALWGYEDGKLAGTELATENGFQLGKEDTYADAYTIAYVLAHPEGFRDGWISGYIDSFMSLWGSDGGKSDGSVTFDGVTTDYDDGYESGWDDAYAQHYNEAFCSFYDEVFPIAFADGQAHGREYGAIDGRENGYEDGFDSAIPHGEYHGLIDAQEYRAEGRHIHSWVQAKESHAAAAFDSVFPAFASPAAPVPEPVFGVQFLAAAVILGNWMRRRLATAP